MSSGITKLERKQKNSPNAFRIRTFLFRSYSFGTETINTSIHVCSRSSLEKLYPIPDQNGQSVFRPKRPKTRTLPLYKGVPPLILTPFMIVGDRDKV